ncbi:MAG: type III-A CRISPR-associated RAMP protein Csm4 [Bacteroidales bacterium]|nr:type III-A CRISPR-associated RAMP protein Csm4 [Bacteroidales bacterium]
MKFEAIKLEFTTPIHIGRGWGDLDKSEPLLHSDTLKSALFASLIQLNPEWKAIPERFFNGFNISSCYPYFKEQFFLPKLLVDKKIRIKGLDENKQIKSANKIEYLALEIFHQFITKEEIEINKSQLSKNGKYVFSRPLSEPLNFIKNTAQQRIRIEYFGGAKPFFVDRLFFEKDSGLYFLATFNDESIKQDVLRALKFLGTLGIGTDRTVGNGFFDFDEEKHISQIELEINNIKGNAYASLGLYLPKKDEIESFDIDKSFWNIKERGGFMAGSEYLKFRHLLKTPIHMFTEGSVFYTNIKPVGRCENLKPPKWKDADLHNIYRCGQPIFIPVKI